MGGVARVVRGFVRWLLYAGVALLLLAAAGMMILETGWAKRQLRGPISRLANNYLTATLSIGRLDGSFFRGLQLGDVQLARDGETIVSIDEIDVSYSLRELLEGGTLVRRIRLTRPVINARRMPDGRWNLAALVKTDARQGEQRGPRRALHFPAIEVVDGTVSLDEPLAFGIARLPAEYRNLDLRMAFDYEPVTWRLTFSSASWIGTAPDLTVNDLSGSITSTPDALSFAGLTVDTPRSHVVVDGRLDRRVSPSVLALTVAADRFVFQEWAGIVSPVANIAVDAAFTATLEGPPRQLNTALQLTSSHGGIDGAFTIDTTEPGWRTAGDVRLQRFNLAPWFNQAAGVSDITGRVIFDVRMPPGASFPRGTYAFDGSHARYAGYEADDVVARGAITPTEVRIAAGTATAYGANVRLDSGTIGIGAPFPFAFAGVANGVDLRQLPPAVPVPHVESTLRLAFDVSGRFRDGFLKGTALFRESEFLGAAIGEGTTGAIDTSAQPFTYAGEGDLRNVDLHRMGVGLGLAWLQEPRYAGTLDGHFCVEGAGADVATLRLDGGGHLDRADLFDGRLSDAEVGIQLAGGSLTASYDGQLRGVNPARALDDSRYTAELNGHGRAAITVRDLLVRPPSLADYTVDAELTLAASTVRSIALDRGEFTGSLSNGALQVTRVVAVGPGIDASGSGVVEFDGGGSSRFDYDIARADLDRLQSLIGRPVAGELVTRGQLTGPLSASRLVGSGTLARFDMSGVKALSASLKYDATVPLDDPARAAVSADGTLSFVEAFGQEFTEIAGTASFDDGDASADLRLVRADTLAGSVTGTFGLDLERRAIEMRTLALTIDRSAWRLPEGAPPPRLTWSDRGVTIERLELTDKDSGLQRITVDGSWFPAGGGNAHIVARGVSLDAFSGSPDGPGRYGGTLELDAILEGSREQPIVTGQISVVDGRVWRTPFEKLAGHVDYAGDDLVIDLRLDQGPGVWLTAEGRVPADILTAGTASTRSMRLQLQSSTIALGLIEGVTDVVRDASGQLEMDFSVIGTPKDPHFDGRVEIANAAFLVNASGSRYRNGRMVLELGADRVVVQTFHIEDQGGHALELSGALGTHELRVGDLEVTVRARGFEILRNEFGRMDIDADLNLQGQFESPRLDGRVTVTRGELAVDAILDRTLFRPYATVAALAPSADAIVALNPWDRVGIGIELHVPNTLRMVGDNIQVSPGTPLGLGAINLRALGDLYLYKDPAQPLYVTGSLDSVTGTYAFQGRRFDLDPSSSINFRGDFNPELYVTVSREISGVDTRVTIAGLLSEPALRLSSTPPLDQSDILSLIVFNTSTNELSAVQQQQLAVRAGTIAAGFLAAPILTAIERSLGLDTLEITPNSDPSGGTRFTIGNEIAPGLVARFSRQFGEAEYDEATIEYYLSRIFRIRATFSDANSLGTRSPFRRVERAGIDFLIFFSY